MFLRGRLCFGAASLFHYWKNLYIICKEKYLHFALYMV